MAKRGVPIQEVAYMLGHESIHTTKKYYTEVRVDNLRDKINTISQTMEQTADKLLTHTFYSKYKSP
jgi:site-specific recombinase XerD